MRNLALLLSIMVLQFFGSKIGGVWFYVFVPLPLFLINKIIPGKKQGKNIRYILFPVAFLLLDAIVFLPPRLERGMSLHVYFREFWETAMVAFIVAGIQWGIIKGLLLVEVLLGKYRKKPQA